MNYKSIILNALLDKYETSKSFIKESNRRIILKVKDIKQYDIENYETTKIFHDIVIGLKNDNLIEYSWKVHEERKYTRRIVAKQRKRR